MNNRIFSLASIALAASAFLSACGGGGGGTTADADASGASAVGGFSASAGSPAQGAPSQAGNDAVVTPAASGLEVAPYFETWFGDSLVEAKRTAGLTSATLAFAITNGNCALDSTLLNRLPDARNFIAAGGKLRISYGGAAGVYAEIACTDDNQLFALMEKLMVDSGTKRFDFDIEGHQLLNVEGTARRARVLARLQAKYPDYYVSFTLPTWLNGLSAEGVHLLTSTAAAGVRIDMVNLMAMSFGVNNIKTMVSPATVGQAVIMGFNSASNQMATIFPGKTQAQRHAMMGITPMIGINDDRAVFTLADAQAIADLAKKNGIGLLSYWSFHRDRNQAYAGMTTLNDYSGVVQSSFQFYNIFKSAGN